MRITGQYGNKMLESAVYALFDKLCAEMAVSGLSLNETARQLGCSPSYLSRVINEERRPSLDFLNEWAHLYGYSVTIEIKPYAFCVECTKDAGVPR